METKSAELNGQQVKISKVKGEIVWHDHKGEDELFFILKGTLKMMFRDKTVVVNAGEIIVVPKGIEHKPVADDGVWMMLFEPNNIKHTGDIISELTINPVTQLASMRADDNKLRIESFNKITRLMNELKHEIEIFGYHDPMEFNFQNNY